MRSIPYIIHQIWFQGWDELPDKYKENVKLLHEYNPKYKQLRWDEKSLQVECAKISNEVLAKFNSLPYLIQKVDLGRYVVLYNYGGVSIDTDMKSLKAIDNTPGIESADCIVSRGSFPLNILGYTNNAIFLIKPKHPLMYDIINSILESDVKESAYISNVLYIHATTGPTFVDSIIKRHIDKIIIIDNKYYEPCNQFTPCIIPSDAIMDHQHANSWVDPLNILVLKILIYLLMAFIIVYLYYKVIRISYKNFKISFFR